MKAKKNFVDNEKLYEAFVEFRSRPDVVAFLARKRENDEARKRGEKPGRFVEKPPFLPPYISDCVWLIATNYARKPNWRNIPYVDEMISDAVAFVLRYGYNFDPEVTRNPFAYLTEGVRRCFLQKIQNEKQQEEIKREIIRLAALGLVDSYCGPRVMNSTNYVSLMRKHEDDVGLLEQQYPKTRRPRKVGRKKKKAASAPESTVDF